MEVLIYSNEPGDFNTGQRWAHQFTHADPRRPGHVLSAARQDRHALLLPGHPNARASLSPAQPPLTLSAAVHHQLVATVQHAAALAAGGGRIILAVGHGGFVQDPRNPNTTLGLIDLAPHLHARVEEPIVDYNRAPSLGPHVTAPSLRDQDAHVLANPGASSPELVLAARNRVLLRDTYDRIGQALRRNGVASVAFLACKVGGATTFLEHLSDDWGVDVIAYRRQVEFWDAPDHGQFVRVFLLGDAVGVGTNTERARTEIPEEAVVVSPPSSFRLRRRVLCPSGRPW